MLSSSLKATLLAALCVTPLSGIAGNLEQFSIQIPTLTEAALIDGSLSDEVWQQAAVTRLAYETRPAENAPAPVTTIARLFATDTTLYLAFEARDPSPQQVRAHLKPRDNPWGDDMVGIKLDTFNNARLAYQFFVNPLGVQFDSIENELNKSESAAWDGIWDSAGRLTDDGFQVEMAIPLSQLSFDNAPGEKSWGIELVRFQPRDVQRRLSSHKISRGNNCQLCQLGVATGFGTVDLGTGLQLTPSVVAKATRERDADPVSEWQRQQEVEAGLDVRWAISPSSLLNATLNPDFSQVEADAGQLNINSSFALFFDEKRAFFLDNKDYFDTQVPLVHTRNIADPDYGLKFTHKSDGHTFAVLAANDTLNQFLIPGNLGSSVVSLDQESHSLIGRYRYDHTQSLSMGVLLTGKQSDNYHNLLLSGDIKYQATEQDTLVAQFATSDTEYPVGLYRELCEDDSDCLATRSGCTLADCALNEQVLRTADAGTLGGELLKLGYKHATRDYYVRFDAESIGKDFRADLGFIDKVDFRRAVIGGGKLWYPEDSWFTKVHVGGDWDITQNQNAEKIEEEWEAFLLAEGGWQSFVGMGWVTRERVGKRKDGGSLAIDGNSDWFDETQYWAEVYVTPLSWFNGGLSASYGDEVDLLNNRLGTGMHLRGTLQLRLTDGLMLDINHSYYGLDVDGGRLVTANLTDLRLNWQLSVESFIRFSGIYTNIEQNPRLYLYDSPNANSENLGTELLYGYKLNPMSVFYLGYADGMQSEDAYPGLRRTEQTLFMKMSYAFIL